MVSGFVFKLKLEIISLSHTSNGDSGTPLMATATNENGISYFYAAGLSSYGASPCGRENMPGVYTRMSSFVDWIVENVIE